MVCPGRQSSDDVSHGEAKKKLILSETKRLVSNGVETTLADNTL